MNISQVILIGLLFLFLLDAFCFSEETQEEIDKRIAESVEATIEQIDPEKPLTSFIPSHLFQ